MARERAFAGQPTGEDVSDRILSAARGCFEQYGIAKTTIEDIAKRAGLTRPSVYKYFAGKEAIVESISLSEAIKVNSEIRRRVVRSSDFAETLTEVLLLVVRITAKNTYLRRTLEDPDFLSNVTTSSSQMHELMRSWWGHFMENARQTGKLAAGLDIDEVITWLMLAQGMLLVRISAVDLPDDRLRRFIRLFVVESLIAKQSDRTQEGSEVNP